MRWVVSRIAILIPACAACTAALAQEAPSAPAPAHPVVVTWNAPEPLRSLYQKHLPAPQPQGGERRAASLRPWERDLRRRVPEIAASEGYFSATLDIAYEGEAREHATVTVVPGPRTTVGEIDISFRGDLAASGDGREERRQQLRDGWTLKTGQPFRSAEWEIAKTRLEEALVERDYAAGRLAETEAQVDAEAAKARLVLVLDSGPRFTLGDVEVSGLEGYPDAVVKRLIDLTRGERYSRERLIEMQRRIQNGPWFSSVVVDVDPDPAKHELVPVKISLVERPAREVGLALGYGTDDGARGEAAFRHRNLLGRGFDLQSSVRVSQKRQIGYADVYLPPGLFATPKRGDVPFTDSVGVLAEHSVIQLLAQSRFAVAGYRHFKLENFEFRAGLSYQLERTFPEGSDVRIKRALAPVVQTTWRRVDNVYDPKRGGVLNVQFAAGSKSLGSGDDFFKVYGQYQYWIPVGANDQILLRTELGRTFAPSRERIPEDFLYRAGGARSNRGYAYQSLGPVEGNAVVGGRYLATATAEYVHWLNERWGAAVFTDVGEASDSVKEWQALRSYGVGARYKTPAGPFAFDVAYAERDRKFRLALSVTIAF